MLVHDACGRGDYVTTCGQCGGVWCDRCDPVHGPLCPWCHGRGYSTAAIRPPVHRQANHVANNGGEPVQESSDWCEMVPDGIDANGDEWNYCTVHGRLVLGDAYVCEGYRAPEYREGAQTPDAPSADATGMSELYTDVQTVREALAGNPSALEAFGRIALTLTRCIDGED